MPRSKNPTVGDGAEESRNTACTSPWRNVTSRSCRSLPSGPRSRVSTSSEDEDDSSSGSEALERRSSTSGGRSWTASSKTPQSIAMTTEWVTSCRTSRSSARMPCSGVNQRPPSAARCRSILPRCSAASPISDQAPQAIAWPASPSARRWPASWSRKALAAAWFAWPGFPMTPTRLEKRMKRSRSRSRVARWRCQAPRILGESTVSKLSQFWLVSAASDSTPTLWITPPSGGRSRSRRASIRSTASESDTSASSTSTCTPRSRSAPMISSAAGSGSRRPFSTMVPAPRSASHSATAQPIPPRPPVTR